MRFCGSEKNGLGTVVVVNVHAKRWLKYSAREFPEGTRLYQLAARLGMRQIVKSPTRGKHLLDLALTDLGDAGASVTPAVADHSGVLVQLGAHIPKT